MRSCIVFSSPRAGTHLVMTGLDVMGMTEAKALTAEEWGDPIDELGNFRILNMPQYDHYRFGAHVSDPWLVEAYRNQNRIYGIYITRDLGPQARSLRAYYAVYRKQKITEGAATKGALDFHNHNAVWKNQPNMLHVKFEDLIRGEGWQAISDHLGGGPVDVDAIMSVVPPPRGHKYYRNTRSSPIYYEGATA